MDVLLLLLLPLLLLFLSRLEGVKPCCKAHTQAFFLAVEAAEASYNRTCCGEAISNRQANASQGMPCPLSAFVANASHLCCYMDADMDEYLMKFGLLCNYVRWVR